MEAQGGTQRKRDLDARCGHKETETSIHAGRDMHSTCLYTCSEEARQSCLQEEGRTGRHVGTHKDRMCPGRESEEAAWLPSGFLFHTWEAEGQDRTFSRNLHETGGFPAPGLYTSGAGTGRQWSRQSRVRSLYNWSLPSAPKDHVLLEMSFVG